MKEVLWVLVLCLCVASIAMWHANTPASRAYNDRQCRLMGYEPEDCGKVSLTQALFGGRK